jgi:hypothetical protein
MPSTMLKGNRNLRKNSKKTSRKSSRMSQEDQYDNKYVAQSYVNDLQNPYNLEFDPLHINYLTPSYKNLNLNNYGVSADQLSMGPNQGNQMYSKDYSMQMPQQQMMQQMPQQQMPQQQMMQQMPQMMPQEQMQPFMGREENQTGGSKFIYKRFLKKI